MKHVCVGEITYTNKKSFDTEEEALDFIKTLGNRWISTHKSTYPDCEFWVITFKTEDPVVQTQQAISRQEVAFFLYA